MTQPEPLAPSPRERLLEEPALTHDSGWAAHVVAGRLIALALLDVADAIRDHSREQIVNER